MDIVVRANHGPDPWSHDPSQDEEKLKLTMSKTGKHATPQLDIPSWTMEHMATSLGPTLLPRVLLSLTISLIWGTQGRRLGYGMSCQPHLVHSVISTRSQRDGAWP